MAKQIVDGEHARGSFFVPMATTEGTLLASYGRGMRLTREAGGIRTTVIDDAMQRAPLFVFADARAARDFGAWIDEHFAEIRERAEATSHFARLTRVEQYGIGKMRFLRFDYTTGDAAGQNMVTKATHAACMWILGQSPEGLEHFTLSANLDTEFSSGTSFRASATALTSTTPYRRRSSTDRFVFSSAIQAMARCMSMVVAR